LRAKGIKAGLVRLITLYPFPKEPLFKIAGRVKGMLSVEMSAGQMVEDVKLAVECQIPVYHFGRMGGIIPSPTEVANFLENQFIKG
jgi:2-oxoglutarate ferredoxin oxidoreductase subunit alpha